MPFFIFKNTGSNIWVPSDNGVTDGTLMRVHGVGPGGNGAQGDGGTNGGAGGGGGERCSAEFTVGTASNNHTAFVGASATPTEQSYFEDTVYRIFCNEGGHASGTMPGAGGSGGSGSLFVYSGGYGGDVTGTDKGGGGGGEAGQDGVAGASGASGGATNGGAGGNTGGASQFGVADYGIGGNGGNQSSAGSDGALYGGGGGGNGTDINFPPSGAGRQGLVIAAWGTTLTQYPTAPFIHGYIPDPSGGASTSGWWLFFSWLFGSVTEATIWADLAFKQNWNPSFFQTLILKRHHWPLPSLRRCCIMHAWRDMTDISGPSIFKTFGDALSLYGTRREWQKRLPKNELLAQKQCLPLF